LKKCVQRFSFKHWGSLCLVYMFSKLQNQHSQSSNLVKFGLSPFNSFFMKFHFCSYSILRSKPKPWPTLHSPSLSIPNPNWGSYFVCDSYIPIIHFELEHLFTLKIVITLRVTCENPVIFNLLIGKNQTLFCTLRPS